ncbi:MAG TPA: RNA-binding domain-containing protein [Verrucomicrobiae bacterium]|nr:RNA-binding domain-containing protein [Verrucomicrobiae bacterium]
MYTSVEVSILVHATENKDIILNSIIDFIELPSTSIKLNTLITEGHWKNPIHRLILLMRKDCDRIFDKLYNKLIEHDDEHAINDYIQTNTDTKGYLYIRLNKQKFCTGEISLSDVDSIRMVFKRVGKFKQFEVNENN